MKEKSRVLNKPNMDTFKKKEKIAEKIDGLWGENSSSQRMLKLETKKILIKLESNGSEKRKFKLKMESESPNSHSKNYAFISELLREFFNNSSNSE